jgi:hypothetical protein
MRSMVSVSIVRKYAVMVSEVVTICNRLGAGLHNKIPMAMPMLIDATLMNTIVLNVKIFSIPSCYYGKSVVVF